MLTVIVIVLLLALAYMCIDAFKMAKESEEGVEAGILLFSCFAVIAFILINCII